VKFCVVGPVYPFRGGIAQHTTLLCRHLSEKHDVEAVSFKRLYPSILFPGKSQIDQSGKGVSYPALPIIDSVNPVSWRKAGNYINSTKPDAVIIEWWHAFFAPCISSMLSRIQRAKTIFICHNVLPHEPKPFVKTLTLMALKNGRGFVVHANEEAQILSSILPNAVVAHTPLPALDVFPSKNVSKAEARQKLGLDGRVILFFGLVRKYKGLIDLLQALALLKDLNITCLVVGEFYDDKQAYLTEIDRIGITNSVRLIDEYVANEDVEQYFVASDIVVLPYRSATQSGVVQVAYRFDRPVIATNVGGLPEAVQDGKSGYLVPPENPVELSKAIRRFFEDYTESKFTNGVRELSALFSWDKTVKTIEELGASL